MISYDPEINNIFTDSRKDFNEQSIFVALIGEHHDASKFVLALISKGLKQAVITDSKENRELLSKQQACDILFVSDTNNYIKNCAIKKLDFWKASNNKNTIIAMTGSNGKTTTKEMLNSLMKAYPGTTHTTKGNLNNHLGVPFTILDMPLNTEVLILEMGTNHPGEIANLCEMGKPDAGFITNIGQSHLEFFHNEDNVFVEKSELYHSIAKKPEGLFVVNADDSRLASLCDKPKTLSIGSDPKFDISYKRTTDGFDLTFKSKTHCFICPKIPEAHNRYNMAMSVALCLSLWPNLCFEQAVLDYVPPKNNRSLILKKDDLTIYLDAYNANPSSMSVSIDGFTEYVNDVLKVNFSDTWFILGDMNELGENAPRYHFEIGQKLKGLGATNAFFIGRYALDYKKGFEGGETFADRSEFIEIYGQAGPGWMCQAAFIKGSRTLQLEELVDIT